MSPNIWPLQVIHISDRTCLGYWVLPPPSNHFLLQRRNQHATSMGSYNCSHFVACAGGRFHFQSGLGTIRKNRPHFKSDGQSQTYGSTTPERVGTGIRSWRPLLDQ